MTGTGRNVICACHKPGTRNSSVFEREGDADFGRASYASVGLPYLVDFKGAAGAAFLYVLHKDDYKVPQLFFVFCSEFYGDN